MSKLQTKATVSPLALVTGGNVFAEHGRAVIEQLNWTAGRRPQLHASYTARPKTSLVILPGVGQPGFVEVEVGTLEAAFKMGTAASYEVQRFHVRINPDTRAIEVGAECYVNPIYPDTVEVHVTVGGTTATLSATAADNDAELTETLLTADTGTGWQPVIVELVHVAAGSADAYLKTFRLEDLAIDAADLPSPVNE